MRVRTWGSLAGEAARAWYRDKAPRLGAALAYYTVFSIAPLIVIAVAFAGAVFGEEAARGQMFTALRGLLGEDGAFAVQEMTENAARSGGGLRATLLGIGALLLGASGVFAQLKAALNSIWGAEVKPRRRLIGFLIDRIFSFAMVLSVGFILMVSLLISTALAAVGTYLGGLLPGGAALWEIINSLVSFGVVSVLFALLLKEVPDVDIAWRDVWRGAVLTSLLFSVGRILIGLYLGRSSFGSAYGAAGSLVIVLVWVYYSSQILFFGAEFTRAYAHRFGSHAGRGEHGHAA